MQADRKAVKAASTAHALEGARIAAERANERLRDKGFPEDDLPAVPDGRAAAKARATGASAGPRVTDDDLDRLDEQLGLGPAADHDDEAGHAPTGTDGQ